MTENNILKKYIVTMNPLAIRTASQLNLRGVNGRYTIGILIYFFFSEVVANIAGHYLPKDITTVMDMTGAEELLESMPSIPIVLYLYAILIVGVFEFGRVLYVLSFLRNHSMDYDLIFEGFSFYFKAALMYVLQVLMISMGLMCFVIPGIMLIYSYRQSYFVLADDTSKNVFRCMSESRFLMRGNKMAMFRLDLSYAFLILIGYIPCILFLNYVGNTTKIFDLILYYISRIPYYYSMGMLYMGHAVFYELIRFGTFQQFPFAGEELFRSFSRWK